MRNILITVMMLVVVVLLFNGVIKSEDGTERQIHQQGTQANAKIKAMLQTASGGR